MLCVRFGVVTCLLILNISVWGQQAQQASAPQSAAKDPQAMSVLNQALSVAGGISSVMAIADYTGIGNITYHRPQDIQGSVTVRASWINQLRTDAALPTGLRSQIEGDGEVTVKSEDGSVDQIHYQPPIYPGRVVLPQLLLFTASSSSGFSVSDKGLALIDGQSTRCIQIQRVLPVDPGPRIKDYLTIDFFIDASTFQVVMMQDVVLDHFVRQIQYADFRSVNGTLVPFSIRERIGVQPIWSLQLTHISFNSGLQDSDFQF